MEKIEMEINKQTKDFINSRDFKIQIEILRDEEFPLEENKQRLIGFKGTIDLLRRISPEGKKEKQLQINTINGGYWTDPDNWELTIKEDSIVVNQGKDEWIFKIFDILTIYLV